MTVMGVYFERPIIFPLLASYKSKFPDLQYLDIKGDMGLHGVACKGPSEKRYGIRSLLAGLKNIRLS